MATISGAHNHAGKERPHTGRLTNVHTALFGAVDREKYLKGAKRLFLIIIGLTLALEAEGLPSDPWAAFSWYAHADLKSWSGTGIIFTPIEVGLLVVTLLWFFRGAKAKKAIRFERGSLWIPLLVFAGFLTLGVLNGLSQGAAFNIALWEVRGFIMLIAIYLLAGAFIHTENDLNRLVWAILIAATVLGVENLYRWLVILHRTVTDDLSYDHTDSAILAFAFILCIGILFFGGTRKQRRYAMYIAPVLFFCTLVMKRRAAFAVLIIALIVLMIFVLRLRPRIFWRIMPPLLLISLLYLGIFWNNTGTLGQPAHTIHSLISPNARDAASDLYRNIEKVDIMMNIKQSQFTGLGFGRQFVFYIPLPDLSFWPFWHYTTHDAILWIWMKDGAFGFIAFWWLMGRGVYDGSKAVETQREEWNVVAQLRKRLIRQRPSEKSASRDEDEWTQAGAMTHMILRPTRSTNLRRKKAKPTLGLNVPMWERTDSMPAIRQRSGTVTAKRSGALALLVAAICMIPLQVTFSYVDLGLTSDRTMLLLGLMLGIIARAPTLLGANTPHTSHAPRHALKRHTPTYTAEEARALLEPLLIPTGRSRPLSHPLIATEEEDTQRPSPSSATDVEPTPPTDVAVDEPLQSATDDLTTLRIPAIHVSAAMRPSRRVEEPLPWER